MLRFIYAAVLVCAIEISSVTAQAGQQSSNTCDPALASQSVDELLSKEASLSRRGDPPRSADQWFQLACIRNDLAAKRAFGRQGLLMSLGDTWRAGAMRAALEALALDPGESSATEIYLGLALDSMAANPSRSPSRSFITIGGELAFRAIRRNQSASQTALRACVAFAIAANDLATAATCSRIALDAGLDSAWHHLRLGWVEAGWGAEERAADHLYMAVQASTDEESRVDVARLLGMPERTSDAMLARWRTDAAFRDSVLRASLGADVVGRGPLPGNLAAAAFLKVVLHGTGFGYCVVVETLSSCRRTEDFERSLRLAAQVVRVWNAPDREWGVLLGYSVPFADLGRSESGVQTLKAALRLSAAGLTEHVMRFGFREPVGRSGNRVLVRREFLAVGEQPHAWTLDVVADSGGRTGRQYAVMEPLLHSGGLTASDVIIGAPAQCLAWVSGEDSIPLAPFGAVQRNSPVVVSYQLINNGVAVEAIASIRLEPYGVVRGPNPPEPLLGIDFPANVPEGYSLVQRELDLSRVEPGSYRLVMGLRTQSWTLTRAARLEVRDGGSTEVRC